MDQVVLSLEHDGRRLNVWRENKENRQRFFVTPLAEIIKNSSQCSNDKYSNEPRYVLTFRVRFWDPKVKATELLKDDWSSVYWDNIYARPDVQTEHYQQSYTYDQGKKQFIYDAAKDQQFRSSIKDETHRDDLTSDILNIGSSSSGIQIELKGVTTTGMANT
uniref:Uncharacterized protein n=1 Tax=Acrobeloides nanus TaxID=290746 RepID=A0A914DNF0_9BILA